MADRRPSEGSAAQQRRVSRISLLSARSAHSVGADGEEEEERPEYANPIELFLTLVGYAVGLGNIWRFPFLTFIYGGGAFLVPYFFCLVLLGLPLFILEMGMGQMYRQGIMGIWAKLKLPRWAGAGSGASILTFIVGLYYNLILGWTIYYLGRVMLAIPSGQLPWSDEIDGFVCPNTTLFVNTSVYESGAEVVNAATGHYNPAYLADFWCPDKGIPSAADYARAGENYTLLSVRPHACPARAATIFWEQQALQQSSGMEDFGGFHWGLLLSFTIAWLLVYFVIFKGVESAGKVVYVTATLPYFALVAFFFRAITLEGAGKGLSYYAPDFSRLASTDIWLAAAIQICFSCGIGFGSLVAFASYSEKKSDFAKQAAQVVVINCSTSIFAGFVVFPILGFLASELAHTNPCMADGEVGNLASIGLSGPGLAFIAFPIAISRMPGGFFWALLFFVMLFCLGIDSEFAMVESVLTVLHDAKIGHSIPKAQFTAAFCFGSWLLGLVFCTKAGIYWFNLFNYFSCNTGLFAVLLVECLGIAWFDPSIWPSFQRQVLDWTGRSLGNQWLVMFKFVVPIILAVLILMSFSTFDLMGARTSVAYTPGGPGTGLLPEWSIWVGWAMAIAPILAIPVAYVSIAPASPDARSCVSAEPSAIEMQASDSPQ